METSPRCYRIARALAKRKTCEQLKESSPVELAWQASSGRTSSYQTAAKLPGLAPRALLSLRNVRGREHIRSIWRGARHLPFARRTRPCVNRNDTALPARAPGLWLHGLLWHVIATCTRRRSKMKIKPRPMFCKDCEHPEAAHDGNDDRCNVWMYELESRRATDIHAIEISEDERSAVFRLSCLFSANRRLCSVVDDRISKTL